MLWLEINPIFQKNDYTINIFLNSVQSYKCRCLQKPITCTPVDNWQVVLSCDAQDSAQPVTCNYDRTIGTSFSSTVSDSMSIDPTIKEELNSQFFLLFASSIGVSKTTGYDWTQVSGEAQSGESTVEVFSRELTFKEKQIF